MTGPNTGAEALWRALDLPAGALEDRRVPKVRLIEGAELSPADRRLVEAGVDRIDWRATLRAGSTGIPAGTDPRAPCAEIVVLRVLLRGQPAPRLVEVLHRAVTAPLLLILEDGAGARLSAGPKRAHDREAGRLVVEAVATGPVLGSPPGPGDAAFLDSLALSRLPVADLGGILPALVWRIEALWAARETGAFRLPQSAAEGAARREALGHLAARRLTLDRLRAAARREKNLATRIAMSHAVRAAEAALAEVARALA